MRSIAAHDVTYHLPYPFPPLSLPPLPPLSLPPLSFPPLPLPSFPLSPISILGSNGGKPFCCRS